MGASVEGWTVVLPVKRLAVAKTRLRLPADLRQQLALAMAIDTVSAACAATSVGRVIVISDDPLAVPTLRSAGAEVIADEPDAGLNAALAHGLALARARGGAVATLSADLPAITAEVLDAVLYEVTGTAAVADAEGSGTTLLAAAAGQEVRPSYGPGSFARHLAAGAADLTERVDPRLRLDVDTVEDLTRAYGLGVGPATLAALAEHREIIGA